MKTKTAVIGVKIESRLKAQAQKRARKLGVPLSYILRTQLLNFTAGGRVELPAEAASPRIDKLIAEVEAEISRGEVSPAFDATDISGMKQ